MNTTPDLPPDSRLRAGQAGVAAAVLVLVTALAYRNSLFTPFVFDDVPSIVENASIRRLWPLSDVLAPHQPGGLTVSGRPLVNLSLALNYAISGPRVWSYHVANLAIHCAAALCLFGLVRRTLLTAPLRPRFGSNACTLALLVAGLWALHPLQTESVTYIVQRAESLAALFYVLTLYAFVRGANAAAARSKWFILSVVACLAGMATKEVVVSAPILVLFYDRTFLSGTLVAAWRRRRGYYAALAVTWVLLAALVLGTGSRGGTAGLGAQMSSSTYALTQCGALVRYLALTLWPQALVFDYGIGTAQHVGEVLAPAMVVIALLVAAALALRRPRPVGFALLWFFALLAPSSSFVPVATQTIAEHRLYLALAAPLALAVLATASLFGKRNVAAALAASVGLGALTVARNADYRSELALWQDTVAKYPTNARAYNNLGQAQFRAHRLPEAMRSYERALELQTKYPEPHYNLGVALAELGRLPEAIAHYEAALRAEPDYPEAHNNLANTLVRAGRLPEALPHYEAALARRPTFAEAENNYGNALLQAERLEDAAARFRRALQLKADYPEAHYNLGNALAWAGRMDAALAEFRAALAAKPDYAEAHVNAGNALLALDRPAEAVTHYERALALNPQLAEAHNNLGTVFLHTGRAADAAAAFERALAIRPDFADAQRNLAEARAELARRR